MKDVNHILVDRYQSLGRIQIQTHGFKVYLHYTQGQLQTMDHQWASSFLVCHNNAHMSEHHNQVYSTVHIHLCLNALLTIMIKQYYLIIAVLMEEGSMKQEWKNRHIELTISWLERKS